VHTAAFSWRSFMSPIASMSTSEAELVGACAAGAQETQFCRKLAAELGFRQYDAPTPLFEDNMGSIHKYTQLVILKYYSPLRD